MKRLVLGAFLGGGIAAGLVLARESSAPAAVADDPDLAGSDNQKRLMSAALSGVAAGALVGFLLDRRAKRAATPALLEYTRKARPSVESATQTAVEKLFDAAEFAIPVVEHAAGLARERAFPAVEQAAGRARDRALPVVEHAAGRARERAVTVMN
jgi:hypothetical protein